MNRYDEIPEPSLLQRHRIAFMLLAAALLAAGVAGIVHLRKHPPALRRAEPISLVNLLPPPPPPPPPPPTPPPPEEKQPEEKMIEQTPMAAPEQKPEPKPEAPKLPPAGLGTNIKGEGPGDSFGLSGNGAGYGLGAGGNGGTGASRWGWYAGKVQAKIEQALQKNQRTRTARLEIKVRIWPDATGRIARAELAGSTGERGLDEVIKKEVLAGLDLEEAPPKEMPLPIVMRITERRPN